LASGSIPSTCLGRGCCNLMPIALPLKGPAPFVCSPECMIDRQVALKRAKRQARHLDDLASGDVPSTCLGPCCCNIMPMKLPVKGPAPWLCSTACKGRLQRWRARH
jgi:hypothetical protein